MRAPFRGGGHASDRTIFHSCSGHWQRPVGRRRLRRALRRGAGLRRRPAGARSPARWRHPGALSPAVSGGGGGPSRLRCHRLWPGARHAEAGARRRGARLHGRQEDEPSPDRFPGRDRHRATARALSAQAHADRLPAGGAGGLRRRSAAAGRRGHSRRAGPCPRRTGRLGCGDRRGRSAADLADPSIRRTAYEQGRPSAEEACRTGDARFFPGSL